MGYFSILNLLYRILGLTPGRRCAGRCIGTAFGIGLLAKSRCTISSSRRVGLARLGLVFGGFGIRGGCW